MAGPKKKRNIEEKSDGEENSGQGNMDIETTIAADFEGINPCQTDYHGIKQLLSQLFLKAHINTGQMSDMIIAQQGLGSVLKQSYDEEMDDDEDDDNPNDVFGVTTIINLTANQAHECVSQLLKLVDILVTKHSLEETEQSFKDVLNDHEKKVGLIINERYINIPAKIADPLMETLQQELAGIAKKNPSYKFDYFLMICKTHKQLDKQKKEEGTIFVNAEEEIFAKYSSASVEFNVSNESDVGVGGLWTEDDKQMLPHRRILLIKADKLEEIVEEVKLFVS